MTEARSLRDAFDGILQGDSPTVTAPGVDAPDGSGFDGLPTDLVGQALASYAETAPLDVAESLSPFTTAWTLGEADPVEGLRLLGGAGDGLSPDPATMAFADDITIDEIPVTDDTVDDTVDVGTDDMSNPEPDAAELEFGLSDDGPHPTDDPSATADHATPELGWSESIPDMPDLPEVTQAPEDAYPGEGAFVTEGAIEGTITETGDWDAFD